MTLTPLQIQELLDENRAHECEGFGKDHVCVRIASIAELPSRFGKFQVVAFYNNRDDKEHAAFVHGDVAGAENVPVRMHSECLTGDAIGSLRCDCRDQLEAAHMLESLKVKSVRLLTNNPKKIDALVEFGVKLGKRIPLVIPPNPYNEFYLKTKAAKSGHMMTFGGEVRFEEQMDHPVLEGMTLEQIGALHQGEG